MPTTRTAPRFAVGGAGYDTIRPDQRGAQRREPGGPRGAQPRALMSF
jgi:hypothetical protein